MSYDFPAKGGSFHIVSQLQTATNGTHHSNGTNGAATDFPAHDASTGDRLIVGVDFGTTYSG